MEGTPVGLNLKTEGGGSSGSSGDEKEELTDGLSRMRIKPFFIAYQDLQT